MNKKQVGKGFIIGVCDGMNIYIIATSTKKE